MVSYTKIELRDQIKVAPEMSDRLNEFSVTNGYELSREGDVVTIMRYAGEGDTKRCVAFLEVPWSAVKVARRDPATAPGAKAKR